MATITFDTLKFVHRLKDSGIPEGQAEALAEVFKEVSGEAELATKRDIERLEGKIEHEMTRLENKVEHEVTRLESKLEKLDLRLSAEMTLIKWMLGILLAGVLSLILKAFFH